MRMMIRKFHTSKKNTQLLNLWWMNNRDHGTMLLFFIFFRFHLLDSKTMAILSAWSQANRQLQHCHALRHSLLKHAIHHFAVRCFSFNVRGIFSMVKKVCKAQCGKPHWRILFWTFPANRFRHNKNIGNAGQGPETCSIDGLLRVQHSAQLVVRRFATT